MKFGKTLSHTWGSLGDRKRLRLTSEQAADRLLVPTDQ